MHHRDMNNATHTDDGLVTCPKCLGRGKLPHLRHVDDGVCFRCEGSGRCEPSAPRALPPSCATTAQTLRNLYRAATRKVTAEDPRGPVGIDFVTDEDGMGWTMQGLLDALDSVPRSREAFRAIGWPV